MAGGLAQSARPGGRRQGKESPAGVTWGGAGGGAVCRRGRGRGGGSPWGGGGGGGAGCAVPVAPGQHYSVARPSAAVATATSVPRGGGACPVVPILSLLLPRDRRRPPGKRLSAAAGPSPPPARPGGGLCGPRREGASRGGRPAVAPGWGWGGGCRGEPGAPGAIISSGAAPSGCALCVQREPGWESPGEFVSRYRF